MGWVKEQHKCQPPTHTQFNPEMHSTWECNYCKTCWRVSYVANINDYSWYVRYHHVLPSYSKEW